MPAIELYTKNLEEIEQLLEEIFGYGVIYTHQGNFKRLSHGETGDEIMLYDYSSGDHIAPFDGDVFENPRGVGLEICLKVKELSRVRKDLEKRKGIWISENSQKPWGTTEFYFRLEEGYLFRIIGA